MFLCVFFIFNCFCFLLLHIFRHRILVKYLRDDFCHFYEEDFFLFLLHSIISAILFSWNNIWRYSYFTAKSVFVNMVLWERGGGFVKLWIDWQESFSSIFWHAFASRWWQEWLWWQWLRNEWINWIHPLRTMIQKWFRSEKVRYLRLWD